MPLVLRFALIFGRLCATPKITSFCAPSPNISSRFKSVGVWGLRGKTSPIWRHFEIQLQLVTVCSAIQKGCIVKNTEYAN